MRLKPGVDGTEVHPFVWLYLGVIALEHRRWTDHELLVTSLRRPQSTRPTLHFAKPGELVRAADVRRHYLDAMNGQAAEAFCRMLQARWGKDLAVLLEPEWLTAAELEERGGVLQVDPHIHVQLKHEEYPRV